MWKPVYLGLFDVADQEHPLIREHDHYDGFEVTHKQAIEISQLNIIVAAYTYENYSGDAFVLYEKDGQLYEVNDSHCSCNGLRNWSPEHTSIDAVMLREDSDGVWEAYGSQIKCAILEWKEQQDATVTEVIGTPVEGFEEGGASEAQG
jgi:hypothetical protein